MEAMYLDALKPTELTAEQRDRLERARIMMKLLVLGDVRRHRRHPLDRDPDAVVFRGSLVQVFYGDVAYAYDEADETVAEAIPDPLSGETSVREFGPVVPAAHRVLVDLAPPEDP